MTRAAPTVPPAAPDRAEPVTGPAAPPAAPRRRLVGRTATCATATGAALALLAAAPGRAPTIAALGLCAAVVGWGALPLFRAATVALRRGAWADVLPAAGLVASTAATACAAAGPPPGVRLAAPALVATLLLAGRGAETRVRRRAAAGLPDRPEAVAQAWRAAAALDHVTARPTASLAAAVAALAAATAGFWLGAGAGPAAALGAASAVLLAACPRAVGGAATVALLTATARALAMGLRPGASRALERAARVDTVVLCRTGTVTHGTQRLQGVHVTPGVHPDEAVRTAGAVLAAAQEAGDPAGRHPVAAALVEEARERFGVLPGVAEFDGYPGLGVRGVVSELCAGPDDAPRVIAHAALVGRGALLAEHGIALPPELAAAVARGQAAGTTTVAVSWDGVARAVLEVADPVRPESAEVVRRLRGLGIVPVLLTGDDAAVARGAATVVGVDPGQVLAGIAADDRGAAVDALRAQGRTVAVLGGPDDAAALGAADVALARPPAPPRAVPADRLVALRDDDPLAAVDALRLARRTVRTGERILTAAAVYHVAVLPAAVAGVLPPVAAAALTGVGAVGASLHAAALRRVRAVPRPR